MQTYGEALFQLKRRFIIIGLTGYTGSGCTTACGLLKTNKKPELPGIGTIQRPPDERRYQKIKKVWDTLEWEQFIDIEASRVIFALTLNRALRSNFKIGQMSQLRNLSFPNKDRLANLNLLVQQADLGKHTLAKKLIEAYKLAKTLYLPFKRKCHYDLATFIEVMQDFGDQIRQYGQAHPARAANPQPKNIFVLPEAIRRLIKAYRVAEGASHFVIDAFRNPFEVEYFKRRYSEFYLVSIQRSATDRHHALQGLSAEALEKLEIREKGDRFEKRRDNIHQWVTSQNIDECSQKADYFVDNVFDSSKTYPHLRYQLIKLICLAKNPGYIPPTSDERNMQLAMSARQNSGCLSRHVGAVVVNSDGFLLGLGWNDPPTGQVPCALRTTKELVSNLDKQAFSEYERSEEFIEHIRSRYPHPYEHPYCFLEEVALIEGRKMAEYTRALHAEENALVQAARHGLESVKEATLYTTDSPCTLCSKKAYDLGIERIVYIEEYPGIAIQQTLKSGKREIKVERFEGIRGSAYFTLFGSLMSEKDLLTLYI